MTLPVLITKNLNTQKAVKIKKAYSVIQNATVSSMSDNGDLAEWYSADASAGGFTTSVKLFDQFFKPYYKILKNCNQGANNTGGYVLCGYKDKAFKSKNNSEAINISDSKFPVVLADGSLLVFRPYFSKISETDDTLTYFWLVYYDTNGPKGPNIFGDDVFIFMLNPKTNAVIPFGLATLTGVFNQKNVIDNNCKTEGSYCAAKILLEGWKINY